MAPPASHRPRCLTITPIPVHVGTTITTTTILTSSQAKEIRIFCTAVSIATASPRSTKPYLAQDQLSSRRGISATIPNPNSSPTQTTNSSSTSPSPRPSNYPPSSYVPPPTPTTHHEPSNSTRTCQNR